MEKALFDKIREGIMYELLHTEKVVKIAMAYFTDSKIIDLLCTLATKGISVSVIISGEEINFYQSGSEFQKLIDSGANLLIYTTPNEANSILHHKFCIIDNKILLSGSYNWTKNALSNRENIIVTDNEFLVESFNAEWDALEINSVRINDSHFFVVPSGFDEFDKEHEGFLSGSLTIIYGESGSGKTSFIISLIKQCSIDKDIPTCFLSSNLSSIDLHEKLIKNLIGLELGNNEEYELFAKEKAIKKMESSKIVHKNVSNYTEIKRQLLKIKMTEGIKLALIDELDFDLNHQEIKELRMLAKQLNIPIISTKRIVRNKKITINSIPEMEKELSIEDLGHHHIYLLRPETYGIVEDHYGNSLVRKIIIKHAYGKFTKQFFPELSKIGSINTTTLFSQGGLFPSNIIIPSSLKADEDIPF